MICALCLFLFTTKYKRDRRTWRRCSWAKQKLIGMYYWSPHQTFSGVVTPKFAADGLLCCIVKWLTRGDVKKSSKSYSRSSWMTPDPSRAEAHLNDVRFNSNWVFFTHDDCLKIDIQYQKILKIPKFGLTEGVIFNSENGKLSC